MGLSGSVDHVFIGKWREKGRRHCPPGDKREGRKKLRERFVLRVKNKALGNSLDIK